MQSLASVYTILKDSRCFYSSCQFSEARSRSCGENRTDKAIAEEIIIEKLNNLRYALETRIIIVKPFTDRNRTGEESRSTFNDLYMKTSNGLNSTATRKRKQKKWENTKKRAKHEEGYLKRLDGTAAEVYEEVWDEADGT